MSNVSAEVQYDDAFEPADKKAEFIVRYRGDILEIGRLLNAEVFILSDSFAIVRGTVADGEKLAEFDNIEYVEKPEELYFSAGEVGSAVCGGTLNRFGLSGEGVLVGIIDSGINNIKEEFGERIVGVYDTLQEVVYTAEDIKNGSFAGNDFDNHGTPVASIAAGSRGIAYNAKIAAVKIGGGESGSAAAIMKGIKYLVDLKNSLGVPAVINISFGTNNGSHRGNSLFEQYINQVSGSNVLSFVVSMGNEANGGKHFRGRVDLGETAFAELNIGSGVSSIYVSVWLNALDFVDLQVTAPDGSSTEVFSYNTEVFSTNLGSNTVRGVFSGPTPFYTERRMYINISGSFVTEGIWQIRLFGRNIFDGGFDIWLPVRSNAFFLLPQADTTLTIPSTAASVIAVAAYNSLNDGSTAFSGRGFNADGAVKPDIAAPGVNVEAVSNTGTRGSFTGTSFAAPHAAGAAALLMEWGIVQGNDKYLYGERLKAYLRMGALRSENMIYPNRQRGYGILCFENTFMLLNRGTAVAAAALANPQSNDFADVVFEYGEALAQTFREQGIEFCRVGKTYVIAHIRLRLYEYLLSQRGVGSGIRAGTPLLLSPMASPGIEESGITRVQQQTGLTGSGVLVGIVDMGINMLDEDFIFEDGKSRIAYIWNQEQEGQTGQDICYGRVYDYEEINAALAEGRQLAPDIDGHGTMVAKGAAGKNGGAPDSMIVFVKLKGAKEYLRRQQFAPEGANLYESTDIMTALEFLFDKSQEYGRPISVVIGMGTNQGSHNGKNYFEKYLSTAANRNGVCISVPAGNEALAGHHCRFEIEGRNSFYDIEINSPGKRGTVVWLWNNLFNRISVSVISPVGEVVERIQPNSDFLQDYRFVLSGSRVQVEYRLPLYETADQYTQISIEGFTQGVWTIRVYSEGDTAVVVNGWLPATEISGTDTFFLSPETASTITTPGANESLLACGGWVNEDNKLYAPSGRGPALNGVLRPDIVAPAQRGTSYSAAVSAGAAALLLQWGIVRGNNTSINTVTVKAYLAAGAAQQPGTVYPNNTEGYGRLDLLNTFRRLM